MAVLINTADLRRPLTGVGHYINGLLTALQASQTSPTDPNQVLAWPRAALSVVSDSAADSEPAGFERVLSGFRNLPYAYSIKQWLVATGLRRAARRLRRSTQAPVLYHEPNTLAMPLDLPTVLTVHDLSWIRHPDTHPASRVAALERYFESGLRRAMHVITDSDFIRRELMDVFGVPNRQITPIALGARPVFVPRSIQQIGPMLDRLGLAYQQYWICIGTLEPRKNLAVVLQAYDQLPSAVRDRIPLVVVGRSGWLHGPLQRQLDRLQAQGHLRQLGYVDDLTLAELTAGAFALLFPSIYEGFGLPVLEAMASQTAVLSSDRASLPEVLGQAGDLLPPDDPQAWRTAMLTLVEDPTRRAKMAAAGYQRAQGFGWARCAQQTMAVYRQLTQQLSSGTGS